MGVRSMSDRETAEIQQLDTFEAPDFPTITTFETDELTARCPFDFGGPDFYELTIKYKAGTECVESKSLKEFLQSYRLREITAEELAVEIYASVVNAIDPEQCYVRLEQARRGGIKETVEVGDEP